MKQPTVHLTLVWRVALCALLVLSNCFGATPARAKILSSDTAFIVLAQDRGFLGNEETREAFDVLARERNAELVFVTDERTKAMLGHAVRAVIERGAQRAVLLPFFLSASDPRLELVRTIARSPQQFVGSNSAQRIIPLSMARPFGESYLAVEALSDRFRAIHNTSGRRVIVVGYGARDAESHVRMQREFQRLVDSAAKRFGFESVRALVWHEASLPNDAELEAESRLSLEEAARGIERPIVVPFHLGKKLDTMMSFTASLRRKLPKGAELFADEVTPHPAVATWMVREANRHSALTRDELGVVFLAHGSDYHWNETMRQAVQSLTNDYKIEFAFCMADPPLVERAVRRLEQRGARGIVIVRVFGLAESFKSSVERMIGGDIESPTTGESHADHVNYSGSGNYAASRANQGHGDDHGHGGHGHGHAAGPASRIRSSAVLTTVGGLEDHPFFAEALLERARALSKRPSEETVILVAHGSGDDRQNEHWRSLLRSLTQQMRNKGGADFRAIHVGTWREDWEDKRAPELAAIRRLVEEASKDGGRALVIPARTTSQGFERTFLEGLQYDLGSGFAPHPLFVRWFEEQIRAGMAALKQNGAEQICGLQQAQR